MNTTPQKMEGTSLDISAENRAQLRQLFPSVFTETVNDKGELVESVDFEKLKAELGTFTDLFETRRERYGMDWPGKKEALKLIQTPSAATLKPYREESVNFETTENLFIEGDNLEVLKLLQKSYYGKVKMIYIDPPYNTGKEFIYPDNYSESLETYLEYAGLIDGDGKKFSTNTVNEGRFHTKWLNMMYPRLYLARNLLRDDGIIFVSIDDNEVHNLRLLMNEVFGEENMLQQIVWKRHAGGGNDSKYFAVDHEYLIACAKNTSSIERLRQPLSEDDIAEFKYTDKYSDTFGPYKLKSFSRMRPDDPRPTLTYDIIAPDGTKLRDTWKWEEIRFLKALKEEKVQIRKDRNGKWQVEYKIYLKSIVQDEDDGEEKTKVPRSLFLDVERNAEGKKQLRELFEQENIFNNPKPIGLIKHLMSFAMGSNDIALDFFSGSSPTAHAALDLNRHDGGKRKFILIQLPEPCAEDTEAYKAGYKTIANIGKERIRRVIKKLDDEQKSKLNLGGVTVQDRGFKVLKLDKSNFRQWQKLEPDAKPEKVIEQLDLHIDHIDHKATQEDLLYEILIKAGFTATEKIETKSITGKQVFSIADGGLLICLDKEVTRELIDAVAEAEPIQFFCLDSAFHGNDQLKANAVQTFAARNMGREKANQIVFKTI